MARVRKNGSIEDDIAKQEEAVAKAKERYDTLVARLKDLYAKRDEAKRKQLLDAIARSDKSYDEIMKFLEGEAGKNE